MRLCCFFCFQRNLRVTNGGSTYRECLERLLSVSTNFNKEALKQAVAMKFQNYLSRHKFNLVCRMQSSVYDAEQEVWLPRNIKCLDAEIALPNVSDLKVDHFVKSLDIGDVCQISQYPGVSCTVTGLFFYDSGLAFAIASFTQTLNLL